ncbi:hypothetical protein HK105_207306 [Polyrhizophydium stewartii]|uniref:Uncharacterized protein n=1 Tax=Polyrhizophydium stewartii TaxID=2732419 RepID=A0ABR4N104_9FUNG
MPAAPPAGSAPAPGPAPPAARQAPPPTTPVAAGIEAAPEAPGAAAQWQHSSGSQGLDPDDPDNPDVPDAPSPAPWAALLGASWRRLAPALSASPSWVPLSSGLAACLVGTLYPLLDELLLSARQAAAVRRDWSSAISWQTSVSLALIAVGIWFVFDRSRHGFILCLLAATSATFVVHMLVHRGVYSYPQADLFGVRSWFPCIIFSACVCVGSVGRKLAD